MTDKKTSDAAGSESTETFPAWGAPKVLTQLAILAAFTALSLMYALSHRTGEAEKRDAAEARSAPATTDVQVKTPDDGTSTED